MCAQFFGGADPFSAPFGGGGGHRQRSSFPGGGFGSGAGLESLFGNGFGESVAPLIAHEVPASVSENEQAVLLQGALCQMEWNAPA